MGEAKVRKDVDPLYGILPKTSRRLCPRQGTSGTRSVPHGTSSSPLWVVYRGVLFLIDPKKDSIACMPASSMVELNAEQTAALDSILEGAPTLLQKHTEE